MTANDSDPRYDVTEPDEAATTNPPSQQGPIRRARAALIRVVRRGPVAGVLAAVAIVALVGCAYAVGSPSDDSTAYALFSADGGPIFAPAATAGPARLSLQSVTGAGSNAVGASDQVPVSGDQSIVDTTGTETSDNAPTTAVLDASQIIKTGSLSLEVADVDQSSTLAKAAIAGLGGSVSQSNKSGEGDYLTASITFRVPSAKWDDSLAALRKLGTKTISEETNTTDVTSQVIDLGARLDNLQRTETALQAIMNKATVIADVLAVQNQLTTVQGQIEQLTAQRDHLSNQAAMSTLTATFQLPSKTVTVQAAQGWTLSDQVDRAGAALVRVGQGLATMGVWFVVVFLPIGLAALILIVILRAVRRVARRGKRSREAASA